ncbi:hypothetical protein RchiOBHm_Chr1g0354741 [Rosa chinensis]|uniref:Uncharacterized protein n=1 Tax=Rosa chinensis TaxID=74649 RepID=A0A2P6SHB3_ROSCH|nr:hypothetical protein RchiOBHm_Chr1g0354741 [Rosa chinensis]
MKLNDKAAALSALGLENTAQSALKELCLKPKAILLLNTSENKGLGTKCDTYHSNVYRFNARFQTREVEASHIMVMFDMW